MASILYDRYLNDIQKATHDWTSASQTFKLALVKDTYTPDPSHIFMSDITGGTNYEFNSGGGGAGYTAGFAGSGRKTFASGNRTLAIDSTNHRAYAKYTAASPAFTWTSVNAGTVGGAVVYRHRTSDSDSELICFIDPADFTTAGENIELSFDTNGIWYL